MDAAAFLYQLSGSLDITAEDLAQVREDIDRILPVIEGSSQWNALCHCRHRIDVHERSLRTLAERCRRVGESPNLPARKD